MDESRALFKGESEVSLAFARGLDFLGTLAGRNPLQVINPVLRRAAETVGKSVTSTVRDGHEAVSVAPAPLAAGFSLNRAVIGARGKLRPRAVGRCLTAFAPKVEARLLMGELGCGETQFPLRQLRRQGFVLSEGEDVPEGTSFAVPVLQGRGPLYGALSIICPVSDHTPDHLTTVVLGPPKPAAADLGGALS